MYLVEDYREARTVAEAAQLLAENRNRQIIAGGTDLLIKMRDGKLENVHLVSIRNIEQLKLISRDKNENIIIGPMATYNQLAGHDLVVKNIPILAEAALSVGGPQIRDTATVGGNICNGMPSADSAPALFVLEARLKLQSSNSERMAPIEKFYLGAGKVDLQPGELLTEIIIDADNYRDFGGCYIKFSPRKAMDLAILGVAVTCRLTDRSIFEQVRISLGVAGPTPLRCTEAEDFARGKPVDDRTIAEIGMRAVKSSKARDSHRGSREFREHLIEVLTVRALKTALDRAGGISHA